MTSEVVCECPWVDPSLWTTHYGAVDPATTHEYNPNCPVHGGSNDESIRSLVKDRHFADNYGQGGASPVYIAPVGTQFPLFSDDHDAWHRLNHGVAEAAPAISRLGEAVNEAFQHFRSMYYFTGTIVNHRRRPLLHNGRKHTARRKR